MQPTRLECCLPTTADCLAPTMWVSFEPTVWPDTCRSVHWIRVLLQWTNRIKYSILELGGHFGTKETKITIPDLKQNLWDEIGEKLTVSSKYWHSNTNERGYCLLTYIYIYSIFNNGKFYIRMVDVVTKICLLNTLYITNIP